MKKKVKGWKCFNEKLQCLSFQFEIGKTYEVSGELKLCVNGFHFHEAPNEIFNYYENSEKTRVCEIEAEEVIVDGDKSACRKLKVVKELSYGEVCRTLGFDGSGSGSGSGDDHFSASGSLSGHGYD